MKVNPSDYKYLADFNKYAKFICDKFNVSVEFDGTSAHTDGKTITLPNVSGMSEEEIDLLYGILLHEVGHIKYSDFSTEAFKMLKTTYHAHLANAIEDARVENSLMKEYDGAKDIFTNLYNFQFKDSGLMEKVFHVNLKECSEFHALAIFVHQEIINIKKKLPLNEIVGVSRSKKIFDFNNKYKVDNLISDSPLVSWQDVVVLTNKIYDLFLREYVDKSEKNNILNQENTLEQSSNNLNDFSSKLNEKIAELAALQEEYRQNKEEIKKIKSEANQKIGNLEIEKDKLSKKMEDLKEISKLKKNQSTLDKKISKQDSLQEKNNSKINQYSQKQEKISSKNTENLDNFVSGEDVENNQHKLSPKENEKIKKIENKQNKIKEQISKIQEKNEELLKKKEQILKNKNKILESLNKFSDELKNQPLDSLNEMKNLNKGQLDNVKKEIEELSKDLELEKKNEEIQKNIDSLKKQLSKELVSQLEKIQSKVNESGINAEILPSFEELPDWDSGNEVQKQWDEKVKNQVGGIVNNGAGIRLSSPRDMILEIEKASKNLSQINLAEIFKAQNNMNKLESFNETLSAVNNTESKESLVQLVSSKRHIPLTTEFDLVKKENKSLKTQKIDGIKKQYFGVIKKLKEEFRLKMKFSKKDYFKGSQEEGDLDARNLWKLASGVDENFYEINRPKLVNKVAAAIAIDISGSMDKDFTNYGENLRAVALSLSEGLQECFIKHEISGFHAPVNTLMRDTSSVGSFNRRSNSLETIVYKDYSDSKNYGLENLDLKPTDNSDGESLKLVAERLLKQNSKEKIIFILTDGKPFLSDSNVALMDQDLMRTIDFIKSKKIKVYALGFNDRPALFYKENYTKLTKVEDLLKFAKKL